MSINDKIIEVAERFEGLVEIVSNKKFDNPKTKGADPEADELVRILHLAGHQDGNPYCASFVEAIWKVAYSELNAPVETQTKIAKLLCPHVMTSYNNTKSAGLISTSPQKGAIGFMQNGTTSSGHAFLVIDIEGDFLHTIEGNTSPSAGSIKADRDGGIGTGGIWRKKRFFSLNRKNKGLWIRGFFNPIKI